MPAATLLDLGAVASRMAAWARGSCASGSPSCRAESTHAFTMDTAWGYAIPTSSLAEHSRPPAGGDEVPRLQEPGQVVEGRVRIAAPKGLHQGGGGVVHGVAALVIPHGAALGHLLCVV